MLPDDIRARLVENGKRLKTQDGYLELTPEILLRLPGTPPAAWLLVYIEPDDADLAFGLCHIGSRVPELAHVRLGDLAGMTGYAGRGVHPDPLFVSATRRPLAAYLKDVKTLRQIVLQFDVGV